MALITNDIQEKLAKLLVEEGLVRAEVIDRAIGESAKKEESLVAYLLSNQVLDNEILVHAVSHVSGIPYVNLESVNIPQDVLALIPLEVAERNMAVPVGEVQNRLAVAMLDATNIQAIDYLSTLIQRPLKVFMASQESIKHVLDQYKTDLSDVDQIASNIDAQETAAEQAKRNVQTIVQDSPISKALNTILEYAVRSKASDIHIEPLEKALKIRCRIDGVLREIMNLPKTIEPALVSRIKILSNLKIDEHRIPQDGQFAVAVSGKEVDLRIAISPVVWGEQVVIRLLDKSGNSFDLKQMGYAGRALRTIEKGIKAPNGMVLTSGPTGSGKSTSLYALIKEIKSDEINIITLEDPVEYKMGGVNQIQVNVDAGLTFATGLRSILRQDPDVVMVGEIRDAETANLAVQASLTGHLVFSTLHTNSAAGILPRLLDMGIEPYLLASTLNTVIGQRLVRRVAPKREVVHSTEMETKQINDLVAKLLPQSQEQVAMVSEDLGYPGLPVVNPNGYSMMRGIDERETPGGYKGRVGLYETIEVDDDIQKMIVKHATSSEIMQLAKEKGTLTMRQDGMLKALTGVTTVSEVNRVASDLA